MDNNVIVIVEDPEQLYRESRIDHGARLLTQQRPQKTGAKHSALLLYAGSQSRFQWEAHDPQFAAALPVLEAYSNKANAAPGQPLWALMIPGTQAQVARSLCDTDPEESTKRVDLNLAFRYIFTLLGQNPQFIGVLQEIPDLCGEDWQEWVHPPRDHANSLLPFRNYYHAPTPWQWLQPTYKAPTWRIESEEDSPQVRRAFGTDIQSFRQSRTIYPEGPYPAVQLGLFEVEGAVAATRLGSITLLWSASPGAQGYRLYTNGVPASGHMPQSQQQLLITGLPLNTSFAYGIVPVDAYGNDAGPLSNVVTWEHSSTELKYVQNLSSDNPDEGL